MAPAGYELSWKEFEQCAGQTFKDHFSLEEYCDVTLACDDEKQVKSHKMVLSACSPFFKKILRSNPHQHPLIYLKGIKFESLNSILKFMYLGETKVTEDELKPFLEAAEELKVKGLTDKETSINLADKIKKEPSIAAAIPETNTIDYSNNDYEQFSYVDVAGNEVSNQIATADFIYANSGYEADNVTESVYDPNSVSYSGTNFLTEFQTLTDMDIKCVIDKTKYPCSQCVYKAASKDLLEEHVSSIHEGKNNANTTKHVYVSSVPAKVQGARKKTKFTVRCNLCEMVLLNEDNSLLEHVKMMHGA